MTKITERITKRLSLNNIHTTCTAFLLGLIFACHNPEVFGITAFFASILAPLSPFCTLLGAVVMTVISRNFLALIPMMFALTLWLIWCRWQGADNITLRDKLLMCVASLLCSVLIFYTHSLIEALKSLIILAIAFLHMIITVSAIKSLKSGIKRKRLLSKKECGYVIVMLTLIPVLTRYTPLCDMSIIILILLGLYLKSVFGVIVSVLSFLCAVMLKTNVLAVFMFTLCALFSICAKDRTKPMTALIAGAVYSVMAAIFDLSLPIWQVMISLCVFSFIPDSIILPMSYDIKSRHEKSIPIGVVDRLTTANRAIQLVKASTPIKSPDRHYVNNLAHIMNRITGADIKKKAFEIKYAIRSIKENGSDTSGDSFVCKNSDTQDVLVLCDGMGSGAEAAKRSSLAANAFCDVIMGGFGVTDAVNSANRILLNDDKNEIYTTLDAFIADNSTGRVKFVKLGSPPCYIIRHRNITPICAESLPLGVIDKITPTVRQCTLMDNDLIIMMTDGVSDALGSDLLAEIIDISDTDSDIKYISEELIKTAAKRSRNDDMSIACIRVKSSP